MTSSISPCSGSSTNSRRRPPSAPLIEPYLDEQNIAFARSAIEAKDLGGQLFLRETHVKVLRVFEQAEALTQRFRSCSRIRHIWEQEQ